MSYSRKGCKNTAQKPRESGCLSAHYYENPRSLEVYIQPYGSHAIGSCRIPRAAIVDWIKRTEKPL